ncbi:hypothetical protein EV383_4491 [Pseudonocardia sediminis]|uniref:Uncharacterized protein n=1 Tax=Pseudonocardia sediminis TaxID=1397368 RepID=A0A4Q7UZX9_PSEST|nr:hypothetical protein [Pseudonocardia sediminis]RZT87566.1 hypothetical protein EV383_4491 [Pseudonocardia sediminis]
MTATISRASDVPALALSWGLTEVGSFGNTVWMGDGVQLLVDSTVWGGVRLVVTALMAEWGDGRDEWTATFTSDVPVTTVADAVADARLGWVLGRTAGEADRGGRARRALRRWAAEGHAGAEAAAVVLEEVAELETRLARVESGRAVA